MVQQQPQRHAQEMRADVEAEAKQRAGLPAPAVTGEEAARASGALTLRFADGSVDVRVERGAARTYDRAASEQPTLL